MTPSVSVVIPSYNRRDLVLRAIGGAAAQTYRPLEIIVVDDGSADGTVQAIQHRGCCVPLIVLRHERNRGGSAARNTGIRAAKGEYIAFLDSDDTWHPNKLAFQMEALRATGAEASYTGVETIDEAGRLLYWTRPRRGGDLRRALLWENCVGSTSSVIVQRNILIAAGGFDETLRSCQDWDLWLRIAPIARFAVVPDRMVSYRAARTGRITTNGRSRISGHLAIYRKYFREEMRADRRAGAVFILKLAEIFVVMGRVRLARRVLLIGAHRSWDLRCAIGWVVLGLGGRVLAYEWTQWALRRVRGAFMRLRRRLYAEAA